MNTNTNTLALTAADEPAPAATKQRALVCKHDGTHRIEYWVVEPDGSISTCRPNVWHKLPLEDKTTARVLEKCAELRAEAFLKQRPFGFTVDLNRWEREAKLQPETRYQRICEHLQLVV